MPQVIIAAHYHNGPCEPYCDKKIVMIIGRPCLLTTDGREGIRSRHYSGPRSVVWKSSLTYGSIYCSHDIVSWTSCQVDEAGAVRRGKSRTGGDTKAKQGNEDQRSGSRGRNHYLYIMFTRISCKVDEAVAVRRVKLSELEETPDSPRQGNED